ncbi:hypothetical protein BT69DRAFT_801761 [Atractiella rhizophila]|nr:hypothetical protein BT69DRAFT_801761 [Atractiella rhizophila]
MEMTMSVKGYISNFPPNQTVTGMICSHTVPFLPRTVQQPIHAQKCWKELTLTLPTQSQPPFLLKIPSFFPSQCLDGPIYKTTSER